MLLIFPSGAIGNVSPGELHTAAAAWPDRRQAEHLPKLTARLML
jgi:hypothetical protein